MRKLFILIAILVSIGIIYGGVFLLGHRADANILNQKRTIEQHKPSSFARMVTKKDTIYHIQKNYDLGGDTVVIPDGCVLMFAGGKITNGSIHLNNTLLEGVEGFQNIVLTGHCANSMLPSELFVLDKKGEKDNSVDVQSLFNVGADSVVFSKGTYSFSDIRVGNVCINANGSTFVSTLAADGFSVINNIFVASNTDYFKLYDATIKGHLEGNSRIQKIVLSPIDLTKVNDVELNGCAFKEIRSVCYNAYAGGQYDYKGVSFSCHGCKNVVVEDCEFYDLGPSEWTWIAPTASGTWDDVEMVHLKDNYIHNAKDDYERGNTPINVFSKNVVFEGNLLEYQKYDGSAFNLHCRNVIVHDNIVRNSYFKSIVDVCEYGDFYNEHVEIYNNDFSAYNAQCVVANAKELIVRNNSFKGLSAVLAYATYYNPDVKHGACIDHATRSVTPNKIVFIEGNNCNCDYVDTTWIMEGVVVHGGYCSGITIQSLYCVSDSINIRNNKIFIREVKVNNLGSTFAHQPLFIRNAKNINISDNIIDSDIPAMGSKYKGAVYVLVYNRDRIRDAKQIEIESLNIVNNTYNIKSEGKTLYTTCISGYSENTANWRIKEANIYGNALPNSSQKEQIYTTGGQIENLTVKDEKVDVKNSPAIIRTVHWKNDIGKGGDNRK